MSRIRHRRSRTVVFGDEISRELVRAYMANQAKKAKDGRSELEQPRWAVVDAGRVLSSGTTYVEAAKRRSRLYGYRSERTGHRKHRGLAIVTVEVAERIKARDIASSEMAMEPTE